MSFDSSLLIPVLIKSIDSYKYINVLNCRSKKYSISKKIGMILGSWNYEASSLPLLRINYADAH